MGVCPPLWERSWGRLPRRHILAIPTSGGYVADMNDLVTVPPRRRGRQPWRTGWAVLAILPLAVGCRAVPVHQQRLVSQPNMQFSRYPAYTREPQLLSQIETGAALSGGATASGCSSCR